MKIVGTLLFLHFERNAEDFAIEFVTFGRLTDNWANIPIGLKQVAQLLREGGGHGRHRPA